jgi:hypothetical protein
MSDVDWEPLFSAIKKRYDEVAANPRRQKRFLDHVKHLGTWENELMDYPDVEAAAFPDSLWIAFAVCHPDCGVREFIVEGSTQACQRCGRNMFRTNNKEYRPA